MANTDPDVIRENLRQAYDPRQYAHYYQLQCYALGAKYDSAGSQYAPVGELPDWPDIFPQFYRVGESRRTMSHEFLMLMKVCYMEPEPTFPDLTEVSEMVRQAYIRERWRGDRDHGSGHWAQEVHRTFMDGNGLGIGFTQLGILNGRTHIQHHPLVNVIWDRHYWNAGRSRFIAFIHDFPIETAQAMFGTSIKEEATTFSVTQYEPSPMKRVKVIEWFDMGIGGKAKPTHAFFLNSLSGRCLDISENEYGCLPFAYYQHVHFPGMRRPVGRMDMQMATQEMRNAIERYLKLILMRGSGLDVINSENLNNQHVKRWLDGEALPVIPINSDPDKPISNQIHRLGPQEPPMGAFRYMEMLDREQNTEGGSSEGDRANLSGEDRTLGQDQLKQQGADIQTAWSRKQLAEYLKQLIDKAVYIGAKFDTAPTMLDIDGQNMVFNDPADPNSMLSNWLEERSRVNINEDNLQYVDAETAAQRKTALWMPFLQDQYTNPQWIREKIWKALGEKDTEGAFMMPAPDPMAMPAA